MRTEMELGNGSLGALASGRTERAASASIRALLPALVPSEARVATLFLDQPGEIIHLSVTEMAALAGCSPSTVVRCCQRLGFKGFQDLKIALAQEGGQPSVARLQGSVEESDPPATVLAKVVEAGAEAIRSAVATVAPNAFERAIAALGAAGRVLVIGVGSSAPIAQDAAYRFVTIGLWAEAPADLHVQHVSARMLVPGDVCLTISHTGSTRETLATTRTAAEAGATTIAVTSFLRSPLTEVAAITLVAGSRETSFRVEAMSSRMAHLTVLDALFVAVALRDRTRATAAQDSHAAIMAEHRL